MKSNTRLKVWICRLLGNYAADTLPRAPRVVARSYNEVPHERPPPPQFAALIGALPVLACDVSHVGPAGSFPPPLFLLGGPIEETSCGPNVAWAASYGGHFDSTKAVDSINPTFKDSAGQTRTQCGDLLFQNQAGSVRIRWAPSPPKHPNATNIWQVKYRQTTVVSPTA